jgi:phosphatidylserine/phosphatidylglycerophosphate/cardiolipin synthase-like enzyme
MILETRREFKTATSTPKIIKELLQMIFAAELLKASERQIWIVSPWLSNVEIFDNRSGYFAEINPDWPCASIRLVDVLVELLKQGSEVNIVVDSEEAKNENNRHNDKFFNTIKLRTHREGLGSKITLRKSDNLHTKGFLFDSGFLSGSMNMTFNGLEVLDEYIVYDRSKDAISQARLAFEAYLEVDDE